MVGRVGKITNSDRTKAELAARRDREDQLGPMRGEVISFDPVTQTATIRPKLIKKDGDGNDLSPPDLEEVPIDFPNSGGGRLTSPVKPGDQVIMTPSARSSESDEAGKAPDTRSLSLSDMRATVIGGNIPGEGMDGFDADNTHLGFDAGGIYGIRGNSDGKARVDLAQGDLLDLLAQALELLAGEQAVVTGGSSSGSWDIKNQAGYAALAAKVRGSMI